MLRQETREESKRERERERDGNKPMANKTLVSCKLREPQDILQ